MTGYSRDSSNQTDIFIDARVVCNFCSGACNVVRLVYFLAMVLIWANTVLASAQVSCSATEANSIQSGSWLFRTNGFQIDPYAIAVGGPKGLQIFHFNGANPITNFTGALTSTKIDQVFGDNANHLYAIRQKGGELFVYPATSAGTTQAPGSPHQVASAEHLIVLPK